MFFGQWTELQVKLPKFKPHPGTLVSLSLRGPQFPYSQKGSCNAPHSPVWESTTVLPEGCLPSSSGLPDCPCGQRNRKHVIVGLSTMGMVLMSFPNSPAT